MGIHKNGCLDSSWFYIFIFYIQRLILKSVQKIIKEMVKKYPNDMELGSRVRWYINWLNETKGKGKEYNDKGKKWQP